MLESKSFPEKESGRLAGLRDLRLLDSPPEPLFDLLALQAAQACAVPYACISLVDSNRVWFKATRGLNSLSQTQRDHSFCAHVIDTGAILEVADSLLDHRFTNYELVVGTPSVRFYAGVPLVLEQGERVGTLCVMDREPGKLAKSEVLALQSLAALVVQAMLMRRDLTRTLGTARPLVEPVIAAGDDAIPYRDVVETQSELISLAKADGTLVYVNPVYARHFGLEPSQMIGTSLFDFVEPEHRNAVKNQINEVLISGRSLSNENRMVAANGAEKWVSWTNSLLKDAWQRPLLQSVGRDVTQRKHAEDARRASQSLLTRTGRVAGVGGWQLDLVTNEVTWSDETRRICEVGADYVPTLEEAIAFYPAQARPLIEQAIAAGIREGTPWDLELPFVTATGRNIWVRAVGEVETQDGKPVRLVGAFQDITERKRLEQRLVDGERFLRLITDSLPLRIAYVDRHRRYRFVNLAHCRRFGIAREDILGRSRSELLKGPPDAAIEARVDAVLAGQRQRFEFEDVIDGQLRRFESTLIPDVSPDGEIRGFFSTGVDVTEREEAERASRELAAILDNTTDYVVQTDWRGNITYMNPAVRAASGIGPDDLVSHRQSSEFNTPQTNQLYADVILPAVRSGAVWVGATTVVGAQGRVVPVSHMVLAHRDAQGRIDRYSAVMRDISSEVQAKQELLRQTATLQSVTEAIPALVTVVGLDGRYRFVNSRFEHWAGFPRSEIVGRALTDVIGEAEYQRSLPWITRVLAGETVSFEKEYPTRSANRHMAISYIPLWMENDKVDGFIAVAQDITQHKLEEVRLLQLSQRDALTGLLNRSGFEGFLQQENHEGKKSLALLYIDLDHFKPVNDQYGHLTGDKVLKLFAQRLSKLVRPSDAVARLGGDEFAIVLPGISESGQAQTIARKVVDAACEPFDVDVGQLHIGASVGFALNSDTGSNWQALIASADAHLYRAKAAGRGGVAGDVL